jgi:Leucine-rich repeat (LRR) protein
MKHISIKALFLVLLTASTLSLPGAIPAAERAALIALFNSADGSNWVNNSGWKTPPLHSDGFAKPGTEGGWHGITVSQDHVVSIDLVFNFLNGAIPSAIDDLTWLRRLDLGTNSLEGSIPTGIGNLANLKYLNLENNEFSGPLPPEIGNLASLTSLYLGANSFQVGAIPSQIGNLSNLENLDLSYNDFSGGIPPEIGKLTRLAFLDLSLNWNLQGPIPPEIGNLTLLQHLDLHFARLSGNIPPQIGNLTRLEDLDLNYNLLTGAIPSQIGNLTHLKKLYLQDNQLSGPIPNEIGNLINLQILILTRNQLTGAIPDAISKLTSLTYLPLGSNLLSGAIPASIGKMTNLTDLSLNNNRLTGAIPVQIFNLTKLAGLNLSGNQLTGSIPPQIGILTKLKCLSLSSNQLTGVIPSQIDNLTQLEGLSLGHNQLTGIIPAWIGDLTKLEWLSLDSNRLTGAIPSQIGNLTELTFLHLDSNQLTGAIPTSLTNLRMLGYISPYESCYDCADIGNNGLYPANAAMIDFLNETFWDWAATQTIAPTNVRAAAVDFATINLTWDAIPYTGDTGGYRIYVGIASGGPYTFFQQTVDKTVTSMPITGLPPGNRYYFVIRTRTDAHGDQQNAIESKKSAEATCVLPIGLITVTSPSAGAKWFRGMPYEIRWTYGGAVTSNVKILLYSGTTLKQTISAATPTEAGVFNWTIPANMVSGSTYMIKVAAVDNRVSGKTGSFSIVPGAITVTAPLAGDKWQRGLPHLITWTRQGDLINPNVKVQLYQGTALLKTMASTTPNDGSFEWTIPATQALASNYKVRITTVDNLVQGSSGAFTISKTTGLIMTSPNGNEIMKPVETQTLRWNQDPDILEVKLEFSRNNGGTYATIADHAPNTGSYDWLVPINFTRNGIFRVSDASGKPWLNDGLLEFSFKFSYAGEGDEPGAFIWFGSIDPKAPSYGFGKIEISNNAIGFREITKAIEPLAGSWHELRVRFDFSRDSAEIKLDEQSLFENAPLHTSREHYFEPFLLLQTGGEKALDFAMDDLTINVIQINDIGSEELRFNVLSDDFDRYDGRANTPKSCWQWLDPADKKSSAELAPDGRIGNALILRTAAGKQMLIFLPFSLPDKVPFDISDKCFTIENE